MSMENKEMFVQALQAAFVAGDPKRYGHLQENPVAYKKSVSSEAEYLKRGDKEIDVTGNSCSAIAEAFMALFV